MNLENIDFKTMDVNGLYPSMVAFTEQDYAEMNEKRALHQCRLGIMQYKARIKAAKESLDTTRDNDLRIEEYERKLKFYENTLKEIYTNGL